MRGWRALCAGGAAMSGLGDDDGDPPQVALHGGLSQSASSPMRGLGCGTCVARSGKRKTSTDASYATHLVLRL